MNLIESCEFCSEFSNGFCPFFSLPRSRIIYEDDRFVVFPTLGSFVEGYLLVCTKQHLPSFAWLEDEDLIALNVLLEGIRCVLGGSYSFPVLFEHGVGGTECRAGACIDHAHFHLVPGNVNLAGALKEVLETEALKDWTLLKEWRSRPYLLVQQHNCVPLIAEVPSNLPSQFLRRYAAAELAKPDIWDWGVYWGIKEMEDTINVLGPAMRTQFAP